MDILDTPALAPPPGITPNFATPENLSYPEMAILQLVVTTLVVGLRLYTKGVILRKVMSEDYVLFAAWVAFLGFHVPVFMMEALPLGVHQWELTVGKAIMHAKLFQIAAALYALVAAPLKIAIILQIRRIFVSSQYNSRSRTLLQCTINFFLVLNIAFYTSLFLFQWLTCVPLAAVWDPRVSGRCAGDRWVIHIVSASVNTASDLITVALPQPFVWRLNLERKRKWGLSAVFFIGVAACAVSAVRLYFSIRLYTSADHTFHAAQMGKWAEPELTLGFSAASLSVLPAFIKHVVRTRLGRRVRRAWTLTPLSGSQRSHISATTTTTTTTAATGYVNESRAITKIVEMDVEFMDVDEVVGWGRRGRGDEIEDGDEDGVGRLCRRGMEDVDIGTTHGDDVRNSQVVISGVYHSIELN